jgi:uncharacterized protein (TIGR00730 family)
MTLASRPTIAVFGASNLKAGHRRYEEARLCGALLAEAGFAVVTGGYGGSMEAVSQGAAAAGGHVIGVTAPAVFATRSSPNGYLAEEIAAPTLTQRIDIMVDMAEAAIALEGSIGTLAELVVAWNIAFVARFSSARPKPVVAVGERWRGIVPHLADAVATDGGLVTIVDDVPAAVRVVEDALRRA